MEKEFGLNFSLVKFLLGGKPAVSKGNRQFMPFLVSFLIAAIFWLLIALTKFYPGVVEAEINYLNLPEDKTVAQNLPRILTLEVNARGFDLLAYSVGLKDIVLEIDVNAYLSRMSPAARKRGVLPTEQLVSIISRQMNPDSKIIRISPQNIFLNLNDRSVKKVPVRLNFIISFDKQFGYGDSVKVTPDSVLISGPESVLNNIDEVETELKRFTKVNETINTNVKLSIRKKDNIAVSEKDIQVVIPVEKYTEGSIDVPIEVINKSKEIHVKILPDKVNVSYQVSLSNYKKVNADMFRAVVDFSEAGQRPGSKLRVELVKYPLYIKYIKVNPRKVDYLIQKQ